MMENCEQPRMDKPRAIGISEVLEVNIQESNNFLHCDEFGSGSEENKQKFNFGAEITDAQIITNNVLEELNNSSELTADGSIDMEDELPSIYGSALDPIDPEDEDENNELEDNDEQNSFESDEENQNNISHNPNLNGRDLKGVGASQDSDETTTDSDYSDISGLSDMSGRDWKPISARPVNWIQRQMHSGANPRELLSQMLPSNSLQLPPNITDLTLWSILANILSEPPRRQKLTHVNSFEDVIKLVKESKNIMVLTGAGVSVSCGIPDFRSSDGIYSRLAKDYPDLPDPQAMFDINYFSRDPRPFFKFAREIYPGQFKPSPCHRFIKLLEKKQKLLRNYTQNIDTLEQVAGIENVIECHGSFSTASCTKCKYMCCADDIRSDIFTQRIPVCPRCQPNVHQSVDASEPVSEFELKRLVQNGIMKPDIVFFGEGLPEKFHTVMASDKDKCDLLIVMGSSLKVRPVALIPSSIPANVPQILINREQLPHLEFDVELLGDSDVIINQLCHQLGDDWKEICFNNEVYCESKELLPVEEDCTEPEEECPQLQDVDSQSIRSNASMDFALRSAGTYSDSGFESSTSSAGVMGSGVKISGSGIDCNDIDINKAMETKEIISDNILPPDILEEPIEIIEPQFHSFSDRLAQESTGSTNIECRMQSSRHLTIDSSKDSGIQYESFKASLPKSSNLETLLPPINNRNDSSSSSFKNSSASNQLSNNGAMTSASISTSDPTHTSDASVKTDQQNIETEIVMPESNSGLEMKGSRKRQSAAERLYSGTYYYHESSSSYVFPGAQVSWSSDSEDEDDDDEEIDEEHNYDEEAEVDGDEDVKINPDLDTIAFSPLLPPSVEAVMVNEIARPTTNPINPKGTTSPLIGSKRQSSDFIGDREYSDNSNSESNSFVEYTPIVSSTANTCNQPPMKKIRGSCEEQLYPEISEVKTNNSSSNAIKPINDISTTGISPASNTSSTIRKDSNSNSSSSSSSSSENAISPHPNINPSNSEHSSSTVSTES